MKRIYKNEISNIPTEKLPSIQAKKKQIDNKQKFAHLIGQGLFLGTFIGLAIFGITYVWSSSISTNKVQSEAFTELYFENYLQLPSTITPKHPYTFQFTLHNLENKDMKYPYEVYMEVGQKRLIIDKGTFPLKENDYKTIQERFSVADALPKSEIVVDLLDENQQIDFWVE